MSSRLKLPRLGFALAAAWASLGAFAQPTAVGAPPADDGAPRETRSEKVDLLRDGTAAESLARKIDIGFGSVQIDGEKSDVSLSSTEIDGIGQAPYCAKRLWVRVEDLAALPGGELGRRIQRSYDLVVAKLPKKIRATLPAAGGLRTEGGGQNAPRHTPGWVPTALVPRNEGGEIHYLMINNTRTLAWRAGLKLGR